MPDFEREVDSLRCHLAKTPEDLARAQGWIDGKRHARMEMAVVIGFLVVVCLVVVVHMAS